MAPKKIFIVAGEHSGDALGGPLMEVLKQQLSEEISFKGVGGEAMQAQGLTSIFPLSDVAVMGPIDIIKILPRAVRRVYQTVDAALEFEPDLLIIIDSPEFTHPIAKRVRKARPHIPIIDYVSPSVWAWRSGRAKKMKPYVDHILGLLPFEPAAHERLGGPKCSYVGHPMIEKREWMQSRDVAGLKQRLNLNDNDPILVVLPGSRTNEVKRLMEPFGKTIELIMPKYPDLQVVIPAVKSVRHLIEERLPEWPVTPHLVEGEDDKFASFAMCNAALAASGTVTLQLALAGTPMVVGYKADLLISSLRFLIEVHSAVLPNLILGENIFPEFIQENCTPEKLANALEPLLTDSEALKIQQKALDTFTDKMVLKSGKPSEAAAKIVLEYLNKT